MAAHRSDGSPLICDKVRLQLCKTMFRRWSNMVCSTWHATVSAFPLVIITIQVLIKVTGQLADTPTRGVPARGLDISRMSPVVDVVLSRWLCGRKTRHCVIL